jgi:hypothetical protein
MLKEWVTNLRADDDDADVWVSCGQTFTEMHESNPPPYRLKPKILKG